MSLSLIAVWSAALASPGPDLLVVVRAAARNRSDALQAAAGVVCGIAVWIGAAMFGVAAVLSTHETVRAGLQTFGGVYLLILGIRGLLGIVKSRTSDVSEVLAPGATRRVESRTMFVSGFITNIANPKALIFFGALFAQFAPAAGGAHGIVTVAVMVAMAVVWFFGVAVLASHPTVVARLLRSTAIVDAVACTIFVVLGGVMVIEAFGTLGGRN